MIRRAGWIALAVAVALCFAGIFQHGLWTPDEPREAEIGREMLLSHFSAVPTLGGEPFLEKPPLYAWITAASYSVFGVNAGAARLPAALFSIGAILAAYFMGKRAAGRVAGLCSAVVLATMWQFSETSHKAVLDTGLTFFVAAGHLAFLRLKSARCAWSYLAIGLCSGLAFLTKAWIGPALLCAPPILAAAAMRDWSYVRRVLPRAFVAASLGVAVLGGPWVMAIAHAPGGGWGAVKECLVTEYVGRTVGGAEFTKQGHANPPWYYVTTSLVIVLPWCLALPAMIKGGTLTRSWRGGRTLWLALIFVAGVVLLSVPSGKRDLYLVPLMPAVAVPVGVWLSRVGSRRGGAWDRATCRGLTWLAWSVLLVVGVGVTVVPDLGLVPDSAAEFVEDLDVHAFAIAAVVISLSVWGAATWLGRIGRLPLPVAPRMLSAMVVLFVSLHAAVRPLIDPLRDTEFGTGALVTFIPPDEPLLAFSPDETTLAIVPFHTGRLVARAEKPADAIRALDAGPAKHLIVMDKDVKRMGAALTNRLALVVTVRFSATREVNVYALKP